MGPTICDLGLLRRVLSDNAVRELPSYYVMVLYMSGPGLPAGTLAYRSL